MTDKLEEGLTKSKKSVACSFGCCVLPRGLRIRQLLTLEIVDNLIVGKIEKIMRHGCPLCGHRTMHAEVGKTVSFDRQRKAPRHLASAAGKSGPTRCLASDTADRIECVRHTPFGSAFEPAQSLHAVDRRSQAVAMHDAHLELSFGLAELVSQVSDVILVQSNPGFTSAPPSADSGAARTSSLSPVPVASACAEVACSRKGA